MRLSIMTMVKTEMRKIGSVQGYNQKLNDCGEPVSGKFDTFEIFVPIVNGRRFDNMQIYRKIA